MILSLPRPGMLIVLFWSLITNELIRSFISSNVDKDFEVADFQDPKDLINEDSNENILESAWNSTYTFDTEDGGIDKLIAIIENKK